MKAMRPLLPVIFSCYLLFLGSINVVDSLAASSASSDARPPSPTPKQVTLSVCTGVDCRVDGSSACLRLLQQQASRQNERLSGVGDRKFKAIRVKARKCLGPCGDGPCVLVLDKEAKRVIKTQPGRLPGSLAPPELFGDNPLGCYQVRTQQHLDFVMDLATQAFSTTTASAATPSDADQTLGEDAIITVVKSTRPWFDRSRNERKVLQRLMQVTVVAGLNHYQELHDGEIGTTQWQIAFAFAFLSNFIMKENLVETLVGRIIHKIKRK